MLDAIRRLAHMRSWAHAWVAGGVAGVVSWASVYPFDTIKSRLQATPYGAVYKGAPLGNCV